jgi:iron complex transport system substrate-binding protein
MTILARGLLGLGSVSLAFWLLAAARPAVSAQSRARRIVSLVPSITECVFAAGAGDRLVGVSRYCDFPEAAKALAKVGSWDAKDAPGILVLKPDLVAGGCCNGPALHAALREKRVPMLSLDPVTLAQIVADIRTLGCAAGTETAAEESARRLESEIRTAREAARKLSGRPRVLIGSPKDRAWLAGKGTFLDDLILTAGGTNAVGGDGWKPRPASELRALDPELVLLPGPGDAPGEEPVPLLEPHCAGWTAVREHRIYQVPSAWLNRPGPRLFRALPVLGRLLSKFDARSAEAVR